MNILFFTLCCITAFLSGLAVGKHHQTAPCGKRKCCEICGEANEEYRNFLSYDGTVQN